jgi:hypothetical protein
MSVRLMALVWELLLELRGSKLIVALALADWGRDDGTKIFPSMKTLSKKARISVREARRIVSEFEKSGLLVRVNSGRGRGNRAEWRMRLPIPENRTEAAGFGSGDKRTQASGFSDWKTGQAKPQNRTIPASKTGQNGSNQGSPTTYDPLLNCKGSSEVDKSTSLRTTTGTTCTHPKCPPEACRFVIGDEQRGLSKPDWSGALDRLKAADSPEVQR